MNQLCRNCKSNETVTSKKGVLTPFFVKRVFGIYLNSLHEVLILKMQSSQSRIKKLIWKMIYLVLTKFKSGQNMLITRPSPRADIRICNRCGFIGPEFNFTYDLLSNLYRDYRSTNYNIERVFFEPDYEYVKNLVGKSKEEHEVRMKYLDSLINQYINVDEIKSVMDWGGGEGKFIPSSFHNKGVWILDVSNEMLINSNYFRVSQVPSNMKFDYIQVCHVLEHVISPYDFLQEVIGHLNYGGYLYIELPQDISDQEMLKLREDETNVTHFIHEHLNLFNSVTLSELGNALNLRIINVQTNSMDFGWIKANVISGLFMKQLVNVIE